MDSTARRPISITERHLSIDRSTREATLNSKRLDLTATEFDILAFLEYNPHQVVTYAEVIKAVWGNAAYVDQHALEVQVSRLRAKLGESGLRPYFIETVRGYGYRFRRESRVAHLATLHVDADMELIFAWVSTRSALMVSLPIPGGEMDWMARWLQPGEIGRMASCAESMFDAGLREATGEFTADKQAGVSTQVHLAATLQERDGAFDGVYAEFFSAGHDRAP